VTLAAVDPLLHQGRSSKVSPGCSKADIRFASG
jgi:hypothetical protein